MPDTGNAASRYYWEKQCRKFMEENPAEVVVSYNFGKLNYDLTLSSAQIKEKSAHSVFQTRSGGKYMGLTLLNQYNNYAVTDSGAIEMGDGYYCTIPAKIEIKTGYLNPTVYLAKSMEKGTCLFRKTVRHEQQHLDIAHIFLRRYAKELEQRVPKIIKETGPLVSLSKDSDKSLLKTYKTKIDAIYNFYFDEWREMSGKLDTLENYEKESLLCR